MSKVILHIGTFKTGSTALQHHLSYNKEILWENNYYYGDYFEPIKAHSNLGYGLLKEALESNNLFSMYADHPRFVNVAENPKDIIERIDSNRKGKNIIISHEALFADAYRTLIGLDATLDDKLMKSINLYMRKRLKCLLTQSFDDIQIICYLRRQDLIIESQFNQVMKQPWYSGTKILDFKNFVEAKPINLHYYSQLEEWSEIFGKDTIVVKIYENELLSKGLIKDFYTDVLGISDIHKLKNIPEKDMNRGLNPEVVLYKSMLKHTTRKIDEFLMLYKNENKINQKEGFFDNDERIDFVNQYTEENNMIAKKFLGRECLFLDKVESIPKVKPLSYEKFIEITQWLFDKMG